MKKDYKKYGIFFMLGWNVLVFLISLLKYVSYDSEIFERWFGSRPILIYSIVFLVAASVLWYFVGYFIRKEFVYKRMQLRTLNPLMSRDEVDNRFMNLYVAHYTGLLYKLSIAAIPCYALFNRTFDDGDFVNLSILLVLSILFFYIHKKTKRKGVL